MIKPSNTQSVRQDPAADGQTAGRPPADSDIHAMKALMTDAKDRVGNLSALFSSQVSKAASAVTVSETKAQERLRQYREQKTVRDRDTSDNSGQEHPDTDESDDFREELAQEVAEHILISHRDHARPGVDGEVRIKIKEDILKDAHVHLVRKADGLHVDLISSRADTAAALSAARSSLEKQLKTNFAGLIVIRILRVNEKGETHVFENDY